MFTVTDATGKKITVYDKKALEAAAQSSELAIIEPSDKKNEVVVSEKEPLQPKPIPGVLFFPKITKDNIHTIPKDAKGFDLEKVAQVCEELEKTAVTALLKDDYQVNTLEDGSLQLLNKDGSELTLDQREAVSKYLSENIVDKINELSPGIVGDRLGGGEIKAINNPPAWNHRVRTMLDLPTDLSPAKSVDEVKVKSLESKNKSESGLGRPS